VLLLLLLHYFAKLECSNCVVSAFAVDDSAVNDINSQLTPTWIHGMSKLGERLNLISGWKSVSHTAITCFWLRSYCMWYVRSLVSLLSSSTTKHQHTEHAKQAECQTSALVLSEIWLTTVHLRLTKFEKKYGSESTVIQSEWRWWNKAASDWCWRQLRIKLNCIVPAIRNFS